MFVRACVVYLYLRVLPPALGVSYLFETCGFVFHLHTCARLCFHIGTACVFAVVSLCVYCVALLCLCQWLHVCKAYYMKSEVVEPGAGASEFICIHSTACLSSEPILITSSSGLLQRCTYSLSVKNGLLVVHSCRFDNSLSLACQKSLHVVLFCYQVRALLLY